MVEMAFKYSAFTVMTPDLTLEEVAQCLQELGYDGVEWRIHTVPSEPPSKPDFWRGNKATVDFTHLTELAPEVKALSDAYDLTIPALGTYLSYKHLDDVEKAMLAARSMECPQIRVGAPSYNGEKNYNEIFDEAVAGYSKVAELAARHGVKANIELHYGSICPSSALAHRLVSKFNPEYIGVIYDPGNMVHEGLETWLMGMELLGPYLAHVHVKNAAWKLVDSKDGRKVWKASSVSLLDGQVDWVQVVKALKSVGYNGWVSMEDFSPGDSTQKLRSDIAIMREIEAHVS